MIGHHHHHIHTTAGDANQHLYHCQHRDHHQYDTINMQCKAIFDKRDEAILEQRRRARRERKLAAATGAKQRLNGHRPPIGASARQPTRKSERVEGQEEQERQVPLSKLIYDKISGFSRNNPANNYVQRSKKKKARQEHRFQVPRLEDDYVVELQRVLLAINQMRPFNEIGRELWRWGSKWAHIERGLLHLISAHGWHEQVHQAIRTMRVQNLQDKTWLLEVEHLWHNASYHLHGVRGKSADQLTPVNRYRIRRKLVCPTHEIVGDRKYCIDNKSKELMLSLYEQDERPSRERKEKIVSETGLPYDTVQNWFKNRRQRLKLQILDEGIGADISSSLASTSASTLGSDRQGQIFSQQLIIDDTPPVCQQQQEPELYWHPQDDCHTHSLNQHQTHNYHPQDYYNAAKVESCGCGQQQQQQAHLDASDYYSNLPQSNSDFRPWPDSCFNFYEDTVSFQHV